MNCYIYFKAEAQNEAHVRRAEAQLQAMVMQHYQLVATVQKRPEATHGIHTWMEVYRAVPDHFSTVLAQLVAQTDLPALLHSERHIEYFMDVDLCA
ncbi:DUF4936 family protein [Undibacterium sp. SXout7W]|uniref:DUF4936 family protein n=1 Tax=Undibacterium sp. SXout7W TaxID=3413049 RepID=UPI003BF210A7